MADEAIRPYSRHWRRNFLRLRVGRVEIRQSEIRRTAAV
jgi:hypothetical protein